MAYNRMLLDGIFYLCGQCFAFCYQSRVFMHRGEDFCSLSKAHYSKEVGRDQEIIDRGVITRTESRTDQANRFGWITVSAHGRSVCSKHRLALEMIWPASFF